MNTMQQIENDVEAVFRDAFRYVLDAMPLDDVRGYADEDGDLDVTDLVESIIEDMHNDGTIHQTVDGCVPVYYHAQAEVLASRSGIGHNLDGNGLPSAGNLWDDLAACIFLEAQEHLHGVMHAQAEEEVEAKWPSLSVEPEVSA